MRFLVIVDNPIYDNDGNIYESMKGKIGLVKLTNKNSITLDEYESIPVNKDGGYQNKRIIIAEYNDDETLLKMMLGIEHIGLYDGDQRKFSLVKDVIYKKDIIYDININRIYDTNFWKYLESLMQKQYSNDIEHLYKVVDAIENYIDVNSIDKALKKEALRSFLKMASIYESIDDPDTDDNVNRIFIDGNIMSLGDAIELYTGTDLTSRLDDILLKESIKLVSF